MTVLVESDVAHQRDLWLAERERRRVLLTSEALRELREHLNDAVRNGPDYIRAYVDATLTPRRGTPLAPDLHPCIAKLIRELVLDATAVDRRAA
jgi:hypothetical protein